MYWTALSNILSLRMHPLPRSPPTLPVELWSEILYFAIRPRYALDLTCSDHSIWGFYLGISPEQNSLGTNWWRRRKNETSIRLVCRLWNELVCRFTVRPCWEVWQQSSQPSPDIERLNFYPYHNRYYCVQSESYPYPLRLVIMNFRYKKQVGWSTRACLPALADPNSLRVLFISLNSLQIWGTDSLLNDIQRLFPNLLTFGLEVPNFFYTSDQFTLEKVETFIFGQEAPFERSLIRWNFPSLHHLVLRGNTKYKYRYPLDYELKDPKFMTPPCFLQFISRYGSQLLSLHLQPARLPRLEPFPLSWEDTLPRLLCLSVDFLADDIRIPPQDHPLRHLIQYKYDQETRPCRFLFQCPNVTTFTIPFDWGDYLRRPSAPHRLVQDMFKECQKRVIRFLGQFGHEIHSLPNSKDETRVFCEQLSLP